RRWAKVPGYVRGSPTVTGAWSCTGVVVRGGVVVFIRRLPVCGAAVGGGAGGTGVAVLPAGTAPGVRGCVVGAGGSRCPSPVPEAGARIGSRYEAGVWWWVGAGRPRRAGVGWRVVGPGHFRARSGRGGPGQLPRRVVWCWAGPTGPNVPKTCGAAAGSGPAAWGVRAVRKAWWRGEAPGGRGAHAGSGGAGPSAGPGAGRTGPGAESRQGSTVQRYTGSCWQNPLVSKVDVLPAATPGAL